MDLKECHIVPLLLLAIAAAAACGCTTVPGHPANPSGTLPVPAAPALQETVSPAPAVTEEEEPPSMSLTDAEMDQIQHEIDTMPTYAAPKSSPPIPRGSFSLLPYLPYPPGERTQGNCWDCWVWASTGAVEIEHTLKTGIQDRLSIQFLNDYLGDGPRGINSGCCGGSANKFVDWYRNGSTNPAAMKMVPWSNANAAFLPHQTCNGPLSTATAAATSPAYQLSDISAANIQTFGVDRATAINNIKSALNSGLPVLYVFTYSSGDMKAFKRWWHDEPATAVWDPSPFKGDAGGEGHVTLLVGYDDKTDPKNPSWLVLNSWGGPKNRPNGTFRLSMNMNYDATFLNTTGRSKASPRQQQSFHIIDARFADTPIAPVIGGLFPATGPAGGGTTVSVTGIGFSKATGVRFGSTPAPSFTVTSDSTITAVAPAGRQGTVDVTVQTAAGTSARSAAARYSYR